MTPRQLWPRMLLVGGLLVVALSVLADQLGVGRSPRFGRAQAWVLMLGVALVVLGLVARRRGGGAAR